MPEEEVLRIAYEEALAAGEIPGDAMWRPTPDEFSRVVRKLMYHKEVIRFSLVPAHA